LRATGDTEVGGAATGGEMVGRRDNGTRAQRARHIVGGMALLAVLGLLATALVASIGHDRDDAAKLRLRAAASAPASPPASPPAVVRATVPPAAPAPSAAGRRRGAGFDHRRRPGRGGGPFGDYPGPLTAAQLLHGAAPLPRGWRAAVHVIDVGGLSRTYLVVTPERLAPDAPVLVVLHGRDMTPDGMLHITGLAPAAGNAVLVYPSGYRWSWDAGGCCGSAHRAGVDDVAFIHAVVHDVLASIPAADPFKVYAVGFSNGGRMAYRLACDLPGTFAGMAAVEAVPVMNCPHLHPLDVEIIAQRLDPLLTIGDAPQKTMQGYLEPTVASTVMTWRGLDHCLIPGSVTTEGRATITTWSCGAGTRLQYTIYTRGAHRWPTGGGPTPGGTRVILGFFQPHAGAPV
jgi:polyhydroxybutyrate depolymerase